MEPGVSTNSNVRGLITPKPLKWRMRIVARLVHILTRLIAATLRFETRDPTGYLRNSTTAPVIFTLWHDSLALSLIVYLKVFRAGRPERRLAGLVSASRDGAFLSRVLELSGAQPVRGSSSRRGAQAFLELTTWAHRGLDLAITPDGPRGPRHQVQAGAIVLAQVTGLAIVPVSITLPWKFELRSWDRFQIPVPFGKCIVTVGDPIRVSRDATDEERERHRQEVENQMSAAP
ncbi:MAG: DUF374 domain-containing protein [Pedosphaera sp.]|nr:DUF374 domain-containing protein [Pedosphaera sp.]